MNTQKNEVKVAALTGGKNVPSARFRVRQLIPALLEHGVEMDEFIPLVSQYPPEKKWLRLFWGVAAIADRIPAIIATYKYDITLIQRELLSTLTTLEPFTHRPRVLDVDDAIFIYRNGKAAKQLAEISDLIICGNDLLAEQFSKWNKNVRVLPTAVDTKCYVPVNLNGKENNDARVIGWIGTSGNFKYLYGIELALEMVMKEYPNVILRIVSDTRPNFRKLKNEKIEFIRWSPDEEIRNIQNMTIGIMPLEDSIWARGKCSFKMLQYMSCGLPVVVSPVGMNKQILSMGAVGFGASTQNEWADALSELLSNKDKRLKLGLTGRNIVESHFSAEIITSKLSRSLKELVL